MKKILIIGIVCILIGGLFCGAAYAIGERYVDSNLTETSASFSDVSKISIGDHVAEIKFLRSNGGDTNTIMVKAENVIESEYNCSVANNTLEISYNPSSVKFGFVSLPSVIVNNVNKPAVINIYIPENHYFEEIYFGGGVGSTYVEEITAESFVISGGVGSYNIKDMITQNLDINCGVGEIKITGATINGDTKIDGGVGEVKISGQANGNIKLNTGVGSVDLDLTGDIDDYNISASKGLGSIKLNGKNVSESPRSRNDGKYNLDIDAGVGSININIK